MPANLPSVEASEKSNPQTKQPVTEKQRPVAANQPQEVLVAVPVLDVGDGYIPRDVYARGLTSKQATNLKRLMRGLEDSGAKLENGSFVNDRTKAVKWLLEQLG